MIETQSLSYNPSQDVLPDDETWARLIPLSTNEETAVIELKKDETLFGRNDDCDVIYQEPQISGLHMSIKREYEDDEVTPQTTCTVLDSSSNGTFINGVKIGRNNHGLLADGDRISLIQPHKQRKGVQYVFMLNKVEVPVDGEKRIENDYIIRSHLGSGAFAQVFDGLRRETDPTTKKAIVVAIKVIDKKTWKSKARNQNEDFLFREVRIMASLEHDHIVKVLNVYDRPDKLSIVMQKAGGGTLEDRLQQASQNRDDRKPMLEQSICRDVMWQMIDAVNYMHSLNIAHRDLKDENILLRDKGWHILISDFGLSKEEDLAQSVYLQTMCGTPLYLAPEILNDKWRTGAGKIVTKDREKRSYSFSVDWWSLGIILYKMLVGRSPYPDDKSVGILNYVKRAAVIYPKKCWTPLPDAMDLVRSLLEPKPEKRADYTLVSQHIWMNKGNRHRLNRTGPIPMSLGTQITSTALGVSNDATDGVVTTGVVCSELTEVSGVLNHSLKKMDISQQKKTNKPVPMSLDTQYKGAAAVIPASSHLNDNNHDDLVSDCSSEMKVSSSSHSECSSSSSSSDPSSNVVLSEEDPGSSAERGHRLRKVIRGKPTSEKRKKKAAELSAISEGSSDMDHRVVVGGSDAGSKKSDIPKLNRKRSRMDRDDVKDEADCSEDSSMINVPGSNGPPTKTKRLNKQTRNMSVDSIEVVPFDSGALIGD